MIYDCFTFRDELDILEFRLKALDKYVDKFVICEADKTHTNLPKEYVFDLNRERFKQWEDKIIYLPIKLNNQGLDFDYVPTEYDPNSSQWVMENQQRNALAGGIKFASEDDIILMGDLDEIPNLDVALTIDFTRPLVCAQNLYYYYFNNKNARLWPGTVICKKKHITTMQDLRDKREKLDYIVNGGWHFSYMGGYEGVMKKLQTVAHTEFLANPTINDQSIEEAVRTGNDLFGRHTEKFTVVELEEEFPSDIVKIIEDYPLSILKELALGSLCKYGENYPLLLPFEKSGGLGVCNPSILYEDGRFLINLRNVKYALYHSIGADYWKSEGGKYQSRFGPLTYVHSENDWKLLTENYMGELYTEPNIVDSSQIEHEPVWEFVGMEDGRLVKWDDKIYLTGVRRDVKPNGEGRMELSEIEDPFGSVKEVSRVRVKHPTNEEEAYCEKNWMPVKSLPYHYIMHANPTQLVKVDPVTGDSELVVSKEKVEIKDADTRGSSQVIEYKDGYLALTHDTCWWYFEERGGGNKDAIYNHRFIYWDKDWNIQKISKPFKFMGGQIEFCCGMEHVKDEFYITFGFEDNSAHLLVIKESIIELLLESAEYNRV